jgi:glutaredoxin 2
MAKNFQTPSTLPSFCRYLEDAIDDEDKGGKDYHKVKQAIPKFLEKDSKQMEKFLTDTFHHLALDEQKHESALRYIYKNMCATDFDLLEAATREELDTTIRELKESYR